ncbi:hypothetical protein P7349_15340, partial [Staphylococcus aureus]|nr:hypothetical protein [Staphylococcus aureus]
FIIPMLLQGLTYVMLFSYSSASPFITQKLYNMTPQQFSIMFAEGEVVYTKEEAAQHFKDQDAATHLPYIYLSAGVSAELFQE